MNVNQAAFYTVSTLALTTMGLTAGALLAQTTTAMVAYGILTALGSALSIASVSAWASLQGRVGEYSSEKGNIIEDSSNEYFQKFFSHIGYGGAGVGQFFAQGFVLAAFTGLTQGITLGISSGVAQTLTQNILKK